MDLFITLEISLSCITCYQSIYIPSSMPAFSDKFFWNYKHILINISCTLIYFATDLKRNYFDCNFLSSFLFLQWQLHILFKIFICQTKHLPVYWLDWYLLLLLRLKHSGDEEIFKKINGLMCLPRSVHITFFQEN